MTGWIKLDDQKPTDANVLEVRILLTRGRGELSAWAQSDGDFWVKIFDRFVEPEQVQGWRPMKKGEGV